MPLVHFHGWEPGFRAIAFGKVLRQSLGLGLYDAKRIVDRVGKDEEVIVSVPSAEDADHLVREARALGVRASIRDADAE